MAGEHLQPWAPQQGQARSCGRSWARWGPHEPQMSARRSCPGFRYHPAVIAHAAATLGAMFPGRFWLGLGSGEALNEHVVAVWPEIGVRCAMMFEAIEVIVEAVHGQGGQARGAHFKLETPALDPAREPAHLCRDRRTSQRQAHG